VLWGPLLDRLGLVSEADRGKLRPIGPGGYTGGECYRALVEVVLAGGDVISDRSLPPWPWDPILTTDARVVHNAAQHLVCPHNRAGERRCRRVNGGAG
jgi:hypothetical protein